VNEELEARETETFRQWMFDLQITWSAQDYDGN